MPNFKQKISNHNLKVHKKTETMQPEEGCNCSGIMGCLVNSVIYKDNNQNVQTYTGLTGETFKNRFYNHRQSFNKRELEHSTTLSTHIWELKDRNKPYEVNWSIKGRAKKFNPTTKKCRLCIKEKYHIIFQPEDASLNERSKLFSTCRHRRTLRGAFSNLVQKLKQHYENLYSSTVADDCGHYTI